MAGDWMKVELDCPEKPEIQYMAGILNLDPEKVFCKLFKVWRWFDKHTQNGHALGVTYPFLDSLVSHPGFAEAMALSGWLRQDGNVLVLPKFDRHNGKTAKNRALAGERKKKERADSHDDVVDSSRIERDISVTREEKSKETSPPAAVEDFKALTWRTGVSLLTSAGVTQDSARTFFGRLVKAHSIENIAAAIEAATDEKAVNPKAYITACLEKSHGPRRLAF